MPTNKYLKLATAKNGRSFVTLQNVNGEPYMKTQTYNSKDLQVSKDNAKRSMQDFEIIARRFLESKGYTITHPSDEWVDIDTTE